jgi:ribosome-binding factor A
MSRVEKVAEAIREEASVILHEEIKDPRLGFITVTRVELSKDLQNATIFFSVLGKDEDYKKTKEALDSALGFIRKELAERINLRFAPEIIFREDRSSEYSVRIQEVLDEIKALDQGLPAKLPKKAIKRKAINNGDRKGKRIHKKK